MKLAEYAPIKVFQHTLALGSRCIAKQNTMFTGVFFSVKLKFVTAKKEFYLYRNFFFLTVRQFLFYF